MLIILLKIFTMVFFTHSGVFTYKFTVHLLLTRLTVLV